ncbi:MAG: hypothetical protein J7M21_00640, partial [Planctomycetes bacterium]|nr:hypothetical protein [Planctomycetota bacterium]
KTGVLLKMDELEGLGERCAELLGDARARRKLARGARAFARENFWSWRERTDRELQRIEQLPRFRRRRIRLGNAPAAAPSPAGPCRR